MEVARRATNGVATRAAGSIAHCGSGSGDFELSYSCQGPSCSSLDGSLQNVVCHKDGSSTLICSTDIKCQPGASSYQSNFTFSQNEPDPWSPTMENGPDVWVPQDQHVMVGGCAKFSLTSDGTKKGTHIADAENACPNVQRLSTLGAMAGHVPTSTGSPHVGATQGSTIFAGISARRSVSRSSLLLTLVFAVIAFFPGAQASASHHRSNDFRHSSGVYLRATSSEPQDLAERLVNDLAVKASSQGYNGHAFAIDLVAGAVSSVCWEGLEESGPRSFDPAVLNSCVASIYGGDQVPQPALRFLTVFGGSILCNYIVSETWPNGQDFSPNTCDGLQDLVNALRKDASMPKYTASAAAGSPSTKPGSPGVFFPVASTLSAQASDQSISISLRPESTASSIESPEASESGTVATSTSSLGASWPGRLPVDDLPSAAASSGESDSTSLPRLVSSGFFSIAASLALVSELSKPSSLGLRLTDETSSRPPSTQSAQRGDIFATSSGSVGLSEPIFLAGTTATPSASHAASPPSQANLVSLSPSSTSTKPTLTAPMATTGLGAASLLSYEAVGVSPSTGSSATVDLLAAANLPSQSKQITSAQQGTSGASLKSSMPIQGQASNIGASSLEQSDLTLSSESFQTLSSQVSQANSPEGDTTKTSSQSNPSRTSSLSLKQSPNAIQPTAVELKAASKLSNGLPQGSPAQAQMSGFSTRSTVTDSTQPSSAERLASEHAGAAAPVQMTASRTYQVALDKNESLRVSRASSSSRSSMLAQSELVDLRASTQGQQPVSIEAIHAPIRPPQTTKTADVLPSSQLRSSSITATDRLISVSSQVETTRSTGMLPFSVHAPGASQDAVLLEAISPSAENQRSARTASITMTSALQSLSVIDVSTDILAMARSSPTSSVTIVLASEDGFSKSFSSHKFMPTPVFSTATKPSDTVSVHHSLSGESVSLTPARRVTNTQEFEGPSLALSSPEVLEITNANNVASAVASSTVLSSTASTAAASLASMTASPSNLASVLMNVNPSSTAAAAGLTGSAEVSVNTESELQPGSSPFAASLATHLPVGNLSIDAIISTASSNSGNEEHSRSLMLSAELSFKASASPMSTSRSSSASVTSIQVEPTVPVTSVTSTSSSGSLTYTSLLGSTAVSHIPSKLSQALVPEPPPANMSMPFGTFGSGNSVYSSSKSLVPTNVPPILLPHATAVVTSSNGNSAPGASKLAPTESSLPITPPGIKVDLTSESSHTTLDTTPTSNLATLCAQNSSAPSFCPSIGCVSPMTNRAHCGACKQGCVHVCYQGACVCPDLTSPDERHGCESKSVPVECETGYYTQNGTGFRLCAPASWSSISRTSTPISNRSSIVKSTTPLVSSSPQSGSPLLLAIVTSVVTIDTEPAGCPPILPDMCDGSCFNTMSEHNHCGGCGNFCSGTCVAGNCLRMSTKAAPQLATTGRMVTTSDLSTTTPTRQTSTATVQPVVVAYIWRGLAGPR